MSDSDGTTHGTSSVPRPKSLVPFSVDRPMRVYHRDLPHWRQFGCTYFVTFRLSDSIPAGVRRELEYEQSLWLKARGITYDGPRGQWRSELRRLSQEDQFRFEKHFNQQVQACLDRGLGHCWLHKRDCIALLRQELLRADAYQHHVGDFVIMPNHVHLLTTPIDGQELELVLKSIKGQAAIACNRQVGQSGAFWQSESHDHIVRNLKQLVIYRQYIAANPARAVIAVPDEALYRADWMDEWLKSEMW